MMRFVVYGRTMAQVVALAHDAMVAGALRISAPGGALAAHQLDAIADVVAAHSRAAPPHASIAGRASIRIESIAAREIPDALRRLTLAGLGTTRGRDRAQLRAITRPAAVPASPARTKRTHALAVGLPLGRASAQQLTGLAVLIRRYGLGSARVTRGHDLELPDVAVDKLDIVAAGLAAFGLGARGLIGLAGAGAARRRAAAAAPSP